MSLTLSFIDLDWELHRWCPFVKPFPSKLVFFSFSNNLMMMMMMIMMMIMMIMNVTVAPKPDSGAAD